MLSHLKCVASVLSVLYVIVSAAPTVPSSLSSSLPSDAPYSVPRATVAAAITCPNGIQGKDGGIVYLIHGTGFKGNESWAHGPYGVLLPSAGPGFDICWVDLPDRALSDVQVSSEYVAQGIHILAPQSKTGMVALVGHSQGAGLNIPWALSFWPSTNALVSDFVALAGDFAGTGEGSFACTGLNLTSAGAGCPESVIQQSMGSHFLQAQANVFTGTIVPTTSLYTIYDEVIQPEVPPLGPTSQERGAANYALQDLCGVDHYVEHLGMLIDPAAYAMALDALTHPGPASSLRFNLFSCIDYLYGGTGLNFSSIIPLLEAEIYDITSFFTTAYSKNETALMEYVCERGAAAVCRQDFPPPPLL